MTVNPRAFRFGAASANGHPDGPSRKCRVYTAAAQHVDINFGESTKAKEGLSTVSCHPSVVLGLAIYARTSW